MHKSVHRVFGSRPIFYGAYLATHAQRKNELCRRWQKHAFFAIIRRNLFFLLGKRKRSRTGFRLTWHTLVFSFSVLVLSMLLGVGFYYRGRAIMEAEVKDRLRSTAVLGAQLFAGEELAQLRGAQAVHTPEYAAVVQKLKGIKLSEPRIRFAYILRRTDRPTVLQFVADADSFSTDAELDKDGNGKVDSYEEPADPGDAYDVTDVPLLQEDVFHGPTIDPSFTVDQWGMLISAYAPIRDRDGQPVAVLGIDLTADQYTALTQAAFSPIALFLVCIASLALSAYVIIFVRSRQLRSLENIEEERKGILLLAAHKLGSPLTIFKWSLEALEDTRGTPRAEEELDRHIHDVKEGVASLTEVLRTLNEAAKLEKNRVMYRPVYGSFTQLLIRITADIEHKLSARQQRLDVHIEPGIEFAFDSQLLEDVIRELLRNAMCYSPIGGVIAVHVEKRGQLVHLEVRDHGCGIPHRDLDRIFNKFVRGANAHLCNPDGNGLGLFIAKGIVEHAGGTIWIESEEGKGTSAIMNLPMSVAKASASVTPQAPGNVAAHQLLR